MASDDDADWRSDCNSAHLIQDDGLDTAQQKLAFTSGQGIQCKHDKVRKASQQWLFYFLTVLI
ncbi:hypothetical protein [Undibacterium crateris]|uniref:hypothetical protein n=1 Tax=Undibacterium crateris TaxID=2528175 RepID=UPI001389AD16|nr:hypothetical protein [Undibacterium crateris]NDI84590.1 hypothetical protein [Undibacterium crateris]